MGFYAHLKLKLETHILGMGNRTSLKEHPPCNKEFRARRALRFFVLINLVSRVHEGLFCTGSCLRLLGKDEAFLAQFGESTRSVNYFDAPRLEITL